MYSYSLIANLIYFFLIYQNADFIFLTIKPQIYTSVLKEISAFINEEKQILVTVAPGFKTSKVKDILQKSVKVIRTMPNTPLLLGKGAVAIAKNDDVEKSDFDFVKGAFSCAGSVEVIDESLMDEIIAVNGSSPAYLFLFAKAMVDYAKSVGIDEKVAFNLTVETIKGSAEMLSNSGMTADELIKMVKSPNGTTEAALNALEDKGFYDAILAGMDACTKRAKELGNM